MTPDIRRMPPPGGELPEGKVYFSSFPQPGERLVQYSIDDLHAHLRLVELSRGVAWLGHLSSQMWKSGDPIRWISGEAFTEWQLAFLAQEMIRVGSEFGPLRLDKEPVAVRAMHLANGLKDHFQMQREDSSADERRDLARSFRYRIASEQYPAQSKRKYWIPRALSLFEHLARSERLPSEPDLNAEFETRFGLPILDFIRIGFGVMSWATEGKPNFFPQNFTRSRAPALRDLLTPERCDAFLQATSLDVEAFRRRLQDMGPAPGGMERHWINPLARRPIVRTALGYVVPSVWMLVQRLSSGIYFDFQEARSGDRAAIHDYGSLIGRLFEAHVGQELACHFNASELHPDRVYRVGRKEWRSPDFVLIEGTKATLIECKTSRLTKRQREEARIPEIRAKLQEEIIPAIRRLPKKAAHIRERVAGFADWPECTDFEFVIVTLDPWWPETLTRELIDEDLRGTPEEGTRYHLMWSEQLEHLGSYRARTRIFDLLRRRWETGGETETRTYLYNEAVRLGLTTHSPRLDALFERFFRDWIPDDAAD